ncbi:MAG: hypothetical protein AAF702_45725 [Chloroflexota bacterium]
MKLQMHITATGASLTEMRRALIKATTEIATAERALGKEGADDLRDPLVVDLELEDSYKLDGLVGYDLLIGLHEEAQPEATAA